jgi:alpha-galactosidase
MQTPNHPDSPVASPSTRSLSRRMALRPRQNQEANSFQSTAMKSGFVGMLLACCVFAQPAEAESKKLKVFILAGQSNMVGHANGHTAATLFNADGPKDEALAKLVFGKDAKISKKRLDETLALAKQLNELTGGAGDPKFKAMTDPAEKAAAEAKAAPMKATLEAYKKDVVAASSVSDRVYISSIADSNRKSGKLGVGYGGSASKIGPEYGFGLSLAEKIDGPILLIKTSWGGKSLNHDFRPPSAGPYQPNEAQKAKGNTDELVNKAGFFYRSMNEEVRKVLENLKDHHPAYDPAAGHEIAGFVWFQGFNDQFDPAFKANYKDNMIAFIKDVRNEYKAPKMPFVIGVLGTSQTKEGVDQNEVSVAQRAAAAVPEFKGNVVAVESYTEYALDSLEVYNSGWAKNMYLWDLVGSDRPYHYLGSGKFFVRLGDAFAASMAGMIPRQ